MTATFEVHSLEFIPAPRISRIGHPFGVMREITLGVVTECRMRAGCLGISMKVVFTTSRPGKFFDFLAGLRSLLKVLREDSWVAETEESGCFCPALDADDPPGRRSSRLRTPVDRTLRAPWTSKRHPPHVIESYCPPQVAVGDAALDALGCILPGKRIIVSLGLSLGEGRRPMAAQLNRELFPAPFRCCEQFLETLDCVSRRSV